VCSRSTSSSRQTHLPQGEGELVRHLLDAGLDEVGAAVAGVLVTVSVEAAIVFGVVANAVAAVLGYILIPGGGEDATAAETAETATA